MKKFDIKSKPSVKYFLNNLGKSDNEDDKSQKEKIELEINVINGKLNYIYGIKIGNPDKNFNDDSFVSQMIKCTNENKLHLLKYSCDYYFGKEQKINIELMIKSNSFKSFNIYTTIGEIVGNENSMKCFSIMNRDEIVEVKAKKVKTKMKFLTIHFNLKLSSSEGNITEIQEEEYYKNEKYKIYFKLEKNKTILYESEAFTDDGKFNIVQIPLNILSSDFNIYFFNYKNQNLGAVQTNVNQIVHQKFQNKLIFQKRLSLKDTLNIYNHSSIRGEITFLDYIKNGVRVALDIGIDFTGSNGHPDDLGTLHCRRPDAKERNPYERAILSCARIMANYDYDQLFPVYGFGAVIKGQRQASMCFNINFKHDPNIQYVDNIMKEYYSCLDKIYFSGPTCFAPIIKKIISEMKKENDILEYHVLMILTDGKIDDFEDTVDALVEGSFLPLSVIIVGIGDNKDNPDFKFMERLDGDDIPIVSRNGKKRQRDLVQFVPFNKFEGDEKKLTEEVLDEIPRQIIEYYTLNFFYPELLSSNNNSDNAQKESQIHFSKNSNEKQSTNVFDNASYNPLDNKYTNKGENDNNINNSQNDNQYNYNPYISNNNNNQNNFNPNISNNESQNNYNPFNSNNENLNNPFFNNNYNNLHDSNIHPK